MSASRSCGLTLVDRRALGAILAIALAVAACSNRGLASPSATASSSQPSSPLIATGTPAATSSPGIAGTSADGATVVDPRLLAILPASIDGIVMQPEPETAARTTVDPALGRSASAIAVGGFFAPGNSGSDDLAVASVVQLRPGIFDDAFYATWRADYDTAACAPAGGIASHARQQIGANAVEVTVCAGGARTYQTHLAGDVLVSVTAVGARSFGQRVMGGLRQ